MRDTLFSSVAPLRRSIAHDGQPAAREHEPAVGNTHEAPAEHRAMVVADPASQTLLKLLVRIAPSDVPVMISGESGTGKKAVARYIHTLSGRAGAFVVVNCSAIADQLAAGESFTSSAPRAAPGSIVHSEQWFESARRGTLFLEEIAALPAVLQSQLLGVLQEREVAQVGSSPDSGTSDVRLIATTKVDLSEAVSAGHFRLELFYRLNVGQVRLLPLRQRRGDVEALAQHFLRLYGRRLNQPLPLLSRDALATLTEHPWPGNARELENVIRFALLVSPDRELRAEHLKLGGVPSITQAVAPRVVRGGETPLSLSHLLLEMFQEPGERLLNDLESQVVAEAFEFTGRNQVRTAALLGISRNVLRTLLRKHGLLVVRRRK